MFAAGVVCLKHEGFHEEREWPAISIAPDRRDACRAHSEDNEYSLSTLKLNRFRFSPLE
jgi:hypothetical protein